MSKRGIKLRSLFVILSVFTIIIFLPNTITAGPPEGSGDPLISGNCVGAPDEDTACIPSTIYYCSGAGGAPTCNPGYHPAVTTLSPPSCLIDGSSGCSCTCVMDSECVDNDGDGYYSAACEFGTDCNDNDDTVYPDAPEICDAITNQCPGDVGHNLIDRVGSGVGIAVTEECAYNGPGTAGVGICVAAIRTCQAGGFLDNEFCLGEITSQTEEISFSNCGVSGTEDCCNNLLDDDCDGLIDTDNECGVCTNDNTRNCGTTDVGICAYGTETCVGGVWGSCTGEVSPGSENIAIGNCADGLDNDCDAEKDWDTQIWSSGLVTGIDDGIIGDNECLVGFTDIFGVGGIHFNTTTPIENSVITIGCEITVFNITSIDAYVDEVSSSTSCQYYESRFISSSWSLAFFYCPVGSAGSKTVRCSVDQSESYNSTADITRSITVLQAPPTCLLTNATWEKTSVLEGTAVDLILNGTNCGGKSINFTIWEYDGSSGDDYVVSFIEIYNSATWTSQWQADTDGDGGNPEYYFIAKPEESPTSINSQTLGNPLLSVSKSPTGISFCQDYDITECDDNPLNLGFFTGSWETYDNVNGPCRRRQNGTGCEWSGGSCSQATEFEYNLDNNDPSCSNTQISCNYTESTTACSSGNKFFEVSYNATGDSDPANCNLQTRSLICPSTIALPFFGTFNIISVIVIVGVVYFFYTRREKKRLRT